MLANFLGNIRSFISFGVRTLLTALFARGLSEEVLYWHRSRLYWEGVIHPDGGHREDQANIELAEGAVIAVRRIADRLGLSPASLPTEEMAHSLARLTLRLSLDEKESEALKTIERLGSSEHIQPSEHLRDHIAASEAEEAIEHGELIREYLNWLNGIDEAAENRRKPSQTRINREEGGVE